MPRPGLSEDGFPQTQFSAAVPLASSSDHLAGAAAALRRGDPHGAFDICREALAADPHNPVALNLAGVAAFQAGLAEEALELLHAAVSQAPRDAETQTNLGNVLAYLGRVGDAVAAYERAMEADPEYADALFNFGILMAAEGQPAKAVEAYEKTLEKVSDHGLAWQGLGNALNALGRLDAAKTAFETGLEFDPAMAMARTNLASVLHELGDYVSAAAQCRQALTVEPDLHEARYNLGLALQELGHHGDAIEAYEQVLSDQPQHAAAALNIAYARQQLGQLDAASLAFERAIAIDPDFSKAHANLADLRLQQGDPAAALAVCDGYLDRHPGNTNLLAFKAVALEDLGQAQAAGLIDFDRFLHVHQIEVPDIYANLAGFNAALAAHIETHPSLTFEPRSHATRQGRHSGELLVEPKGPFADLEKVILAAVESYKTAIGKDLAHPFLRALPEGMMLSVWGVVMEAAGHQIPHIHPAAWLSGVYYAKVPGIVAEGTPDKAGWIEFGRLPDHFHNETEPQTRAIRPDPGLMVLFPSYFHHRTIPFHADGTRISIAFDLIAA